MSGELFKQCPIIKYETKGFDYNTMTKQRFENGLSVRRTIIRIGKEKI